MLVDGRSNYRNPNDDNATSPPRRCELLLCYAKKNQERGAGPTRHEPIAIRRSASAFATGAAGSRRPVASLTHNAEDFHELHRERPGHRGIIAVYRDADPRRNIDHAQIAASIRRLESLQVTIAGEFHVLNHWR
jgi:hypothetical protein